MPAGRPSKYNPSYCEQARKLCRLGATDVEIADFFEVSVSTLFRWKDAHPEFREALKEAKADADRRVADSLYHKAVGYTFDSEKVFQFQGQIVRGKTREHVPPDTTAAIFWLKNRDPENWRERQQHEIMGKDGGPIQTEDVSARDILTGRIAGLSARLEANSGSAKPH